jgi:hypothetical protein
VARFEGLFKLLDALLAICFACSTFIFLVLLFRGVLAPFTRQPRERGREIGDRSGEIGAFGSERAARLPQDSFGAQIVPAQDGIANRRQLLGRRRKDWLFSWVEVALGRRFWICVCGCPDSASPQARPTPEKVANRSKGGESVAVQGIENCAARSIPDEKMAASAALETEAHDRGGGALEEATSGPVEAAGIAFETAAQLWWRAACSQLKE